MIVRLRTLDFINLAHCAKGEPLPDGGMRVYVVDTQPSDLPPDDADRIRRRVRDIDPEPLPGESGRPDGGTRPARIETPATIREKAPARSSQGKRRRG